MADLTRDDVIRLAKLARIELSEADTEALAHELPRIMEYVEQLRHVDLGDLTPTDQVSGLQNVMREDEPWDYGYTPDDLLKQVPAVEARQIKVKRMLQG